MAKFRSGDLYLKDGQYIKLGTSQDANIWWDGSGLRLDTTISGVTPTEDYHLATKAYADSVSGTGGGGVTDHGELTGLDGDDHSQYVLADGTRAFTGVFDNIGMNVTEGDIQFQSVMSDLDASGNTISGTLTGVSNFGQALYVKSDGQFGLAKADSTLTMPVSALTTGSGNGVQKILTYGYARNDGWDWTPGGILYASDATAGAFTQTAPTASGSQLQAVGVATHADRIFFNPSFVVAEIGDIEYYTSEQLTSSGVLDERYYTETELDNGVLDSRYYTETEIDAGYLPLTGGTLTGSLIIQQNLIVSGTQFITETETVQIEDNLLVLNHGEPGAGVTEGTAGIEIDRGSETNYQFLFDDTYDNFRVGISGSLQPVATRMESDDMTASGIPFWADGTYRFETSSGFTYSGGNVSVESAAPTDAAHLTRKDYVDAEVAAVSGTGSGVTDHGELTGLDGDDHSQYMLADGTRAFSGVYDSVGTVLTDGDIQFQSVPSTNEDVSGNTSSGTVTSATAFGQALYMKSDGSWGLAKADSDTTMPVAAFSTVSGTNVQKVLTYGYIRKDEWDWTPGGILYASDDVAGNVTQTVPTASGSQVQVVGVATHADRIFFNPSYVLAELGDSPYYTQNELTSSGVLDSRYYVKDSDIIHGRQSIGDGVDHIDVTFSGASDTNYTVNTTLENTNDSPPSIYAYIVSAKSADGFTVTFMGDTDSANYTLNWSVILDQ
jgi:hypothetical protein